MLLLQSSTSEQKFSSKKVSTLALNFKSPCALKALLDISYPELVTGNSKALVNIN
jgi:hypothetical protein